MSPLSRDEIETLVKAYFAASGETESKAQLFFERAIHLTPELLSNPLQLVTLCSVYSRTGVLPRLAVDAPRIAIDLMLERWDRMRGLSEQVLFPIATKVVLGQLAYRVMMAEGQGVVLSEEQILSDLRDLYFENYSGRSAEAENLARGAFEAIVQRSELIVGAGLDAVGTPLYQFHHRSEMEYLAATAACRIHNTPELLANWIRGNSDRTSLVRMFAMSIAELDRNYFGGAQLVVSSLLEMADRSSLPPNNVLMPLLCEVLGLGILPPGLSAELASILSD